MRVVSGEYGGRKLKALGGDKTRPTSDKVKGAIFNRIGPYFDGGVVLDLFSGSGSLGIEAVSRGCDKAYLVDKSYQAIAIINENIVMTKEADKFIVIKSDANQALESFASKGIKFDYVFLDPPYVTQEITKQLEFMVKTGSLSRGALIVCETDKSVALPEKVNGFDFVKRQVYGNSEIVIFERSLEDD